MKQPKAPIFFAGWVIALLFSAGISALADTVYLQPNTTAQATRACSFDGVHTQQVAVSGTSAKTANVTGKGVVRVYCTQVAHMFQSLNGATGATAGTGDMTVPAAQPEYFYSNASYFAFVQDAAAGICEVTDCH